MILNIILTIAVIVLAIYASKPFERRANKNDGSAGENQVIALLNKRFKGDKTMYILNDLTLPFEDGSTQIDHLVISQKGIFVIETKHYSGWIFGAPNAPQWQQVLYKVKTSFQNPLRQNYKHIIVLKNYLKDMPDVYQSIVCFTGSAEFKSPMPDNVLYSQYLIDFIDEFKKDVLTLEQVLLIIGTLYMYRLSKTKETYNQHVAYLQQKFDKKNK